MSYLQAVQESGAKKKHESRFSNLVGCCGGQRRYVFTQSKVRRRASVEMF